MTENPKVAVVILNYNSEGDTKICTEHIARQEGVRLSIILVDNASRPDSVAEICDWLAEQHPDAIIGSEADVRSAITNDPDRAETSGQIYFVTHDENSGYSAGNNIGIRLADALGADAVLIANPDMRVENPNYLAALSQQLFSDDHNYIAASRIVGLDGVDQNPLIEATFWEELLWPRIYLAKLLGQAPYVLPSAIGKPIAVPKVSGCCLLLRMAFLQATEYLDENVFLYCEEPILSARVRMNGGRIIYVPSVSAVHAHVRGEKGNTGKRMLLFIKSRKYYLHQYSGYTKLQLRLLGLSYGILALASKARAALAR